MSTATYSIPLYEVAAGALIRMAIEASRIGFDRKHPKQFIYYGAWRALRQAAERITERQALQLTIHEGDLVDAALDFIQPGRDRDLVRSLLLNTRS